MLDARSEAWLRLRLARQPPKREGSQKVVRACCVMASRGGLQRERGAMSALATGMEEVTRLRGLLSNRVEFEDPPTLGCFYWITEIDTIDDAEKLETERNGSRERTENVAEVPDALHGIQLGRAYLFGRPVPRRDGRVASRAQVAHPLGLAPGGPDPTPAPYLNNRQWRSASQAALPAVNADEPVKAQRYASVQKEHQDWTEEPNPPWNTSMRRQCILLYARTHHVITHIRSSFSCGCLRRFVSALHR